jgi:hypothetical protein
MAEGISVDKNKESMIECSPSNEHKAEAYKIELLKARSDFLTIKSDAYRAIGNIDKVLKQFN